MDRVIRTLRERFGHYMTHNNTRIFIHKLPDFVSAYNQSLHSALPQSISPAEVRPKNEVWKHRSARYFRRAPGYTKHKNLKLGQIVCITRYPGRFKKSTDATFTSEKFVISKVLHTKPTTYTISKPMPDSLLLILY